MNIRMRAKLFKMVAGLMVMGIVAISCKKDAEGPDEDGSKGKLTDIVPEAYLKKLRDSGMKLHDGNNPPDVEGSYLLSPWRFDYNSEGSPTGYPQPGQLMSYDITIQFSEQGGGNSDISVAFGGNYLKGVALESPFVVGSGNDFTVCFVMNLLGPDALFQIPFAHLISGTKDGNVLKDVQMGRVCLDGGKYEELGFERTLVGSIDIYADADGLSERLP